MKRSLPLLVGLIALSAGPSQSQPADAQGPFTDVAAMNWANDAINQLAAQGIFTGYPDGQFHGRDAITRYETLVAMVRPIVHTCGLRADAGLEEPFSANLILAADVPGTPPSQTPMTPPFSDVDSDHWGSDAVRQMVQWDIAKGYPDGTFRGNQALTRYEFAVAMQRFFLQVQQLVDVRMREMERRRQPQVPTAPAPAPNSGKPTTPPDAPKGTP